jgi:large subunit ribosomal protein L29
MKAVTEIRALSVTQLHSQLNELRRELLKLNASLATGVNPAKPGKIRQTRKQIARILTIIPQKEGQ